MKIFLVIIILFFAYPVLATTYYIDPSCTYNGNGTGESCAAGAGQNGAYNAWEKVSLARGNSYLQKMSTTYFGAVSVAAAVSGTSAITLGAYGSGDLPIIAARDNINTGWEDMGSGIYRCKTSEYPSIFWAAASGAWGNLVFRDTVNTTNPDLGKWSRTSGYYIYYHPDTGRGQPLPGANWAIFQKDSAGTACITVTTSYVNIDSLHVTRGAQAGIAVAGSTAAETTNVNISNVTADYIGVMQNNTATGRIGNGICYNWNTGSSITSNCTTEYNIDHGLNAEGIDSTSTTRRPHDITFDNCISRYNGSCGVAIISDHPALPCNNITVSGCQIYGNGTGGVTNDTNAQSGINYNGAEGTITRNQVYDNAGAGIWMARQPYNPDTNNGAKLNITYNVIYHNSLGIHSNQVNYVKDIGGIALPPTYAGPNTGGTAGVVTISNNTIVQNGILGVSQYYDPVTYPIVLTNNIIVGHTAQDYSVDGNMLTQAGALSTNNVFSVEGYGATNFISHKYVSYSNITTWNDLSFVGTDYRHNPLFVSPSDYHLQPTSPCIGIGAYTRTIQPPIWKGIIQ